MSLKVFLTADVHLGMKFASYPEVQTELSNARFKTLENCINWANKEECDLFVVAGDLFDRVSVSDDDIIRAVKTIGDFQGHLAALLPGNHDYYSTGKNDIWTLFRENAGDNILILKKREIYSLKHYDLDVNLFPAACDAKHSKKNHLDWIKESNRDQNIKYHIGIAHGSFEGFSPDFNEEFFPLTREDLLECKLDLWLLGHTHVQYPDKEGNLDKIFYPGTPEPDGFDCNHEGKAWIINIDDGKNIRSTSLSTGTYNFLHDSVELNSLSDMEKLRTRYISSEYKKTLLKLMLRGSIPKDVYKDLAPLIHNLGEDLFYLYQPVDTGELKEEITLKDIDRDFTEGSFPYRLLKDLSKNDDSLALQIAYELIQEVMK